MNQNSNEIANSQEEDWDTSYEDDAMMEIVATMAPAPGGLNGSKKKIDEPENIDIELDHMREYTNGYNDIIN